MSIKVLTAPSWEPVSLDEAKAHLRVLSSDEDAYIGSLIESARLEAEKATRRRLAAVTLELHLDAFPVCSEIELKGAPLRSVVAVRYYDAAGVDHELDAAAYYVDTASEPGRIVAARAWPSAACRPGAVRIEYEAGYATAEDVPADIKHACLLLVGHWYANREEVVTGTIATELPAAADRLLLRNRVWP